MHLQTIENTVTWLLYHWTTSKDVTKYRDLQPRVVGRQEADVSSEGDLIITSGLKVVSWLYNQLKRSDRLSPEGPAKVAKEHQLLRNRDYTGMWVRRGSTNLIAGKVVFLRGLLSPIRVVDLMFASRDEPLREPDLRMYPCTTRSTPTKFKQHQVTTTRPMNCYAKVSTRFGRSRHRFFFSPVRMWTAIRDQESVNQESVSAC
ncbi:hypothetical protein TNCV_5027451 [Trichonephila clavipes]|nr:hypothetical protein TNCV_5027451 [Trichonephila clavipes]